MAKQKSKKVNPRRIPLARREIDKEAILEDATRDDLYHAWLLVFNAMIEQEQIAFDDIVDFTEAVNAYIRKPSNNDALKKDETRRAELLMGIPCPHANMNLGRIKSAVELEAFKRKVYRVAIHTALSVLCLGLKSTGRFNKFDSYDIYDEAGETVYVVKGQFSWGHCLKVFDAQGNELGTVRERVLTFLPKFEVYLGDQYIGQISKEFTLFRPRYNIYFNGWHIDGDWLEWDYSIIGAGGEPIAIVSKELFELTDTYVIDIAHERDALYALMLVLAIDAEKCSRN